MAELKTTQTARAKFLGSLFPQERLTPAEWAEKYRVLSREESSEAGPYSFAKTPYWRFVCDLIGQAGVEEVVCLKGAQIGWSEVCRNLLGYWIDQEPDPAMVLTADQQSADNFKIERIEPLLRNTPAVGRHLTSRAWDETKYRIRLATMSVFLAWAGSKSGTKSRPIRYLICEEPDEYPHFSSTGGDPLAKAMKRITTYSDKGRARVLIGGTPTTRSGNVSKRWEMCAVRYHYWVPCPHCNAYQTLHWKQVKWPELADEPNRAKRAERIESEGLAFYECQHCKSEVRDHQKSRMLRRGVWATEDQVVSADGRVVGPTGKSRRVGIKISGLYSPWVKFGTLAKEWIESQNDPDALADFVNQRLAEAFEEQRAKTQPSVIGKKAIGSPSPMLIPKWARVLIATADTQGVDERTGYFWYVIRAWGYDYRSQLIDYGVCHSKVELHQRCLERPIPIEGGGQATAATLLVDSGGPRWNEIYQFAQSDQRIHPTKGDAERRTWMVDERPQKRHGVVLWLIDTDQSKDLLHRLIHDPDETKWLPHSKVIDQDALKLGVSLDDVVAKSDYCRQLASESKIYDPTERRERWVEIIKDMNHLWDCEHQQVAAAWRIGMGIPEPAVTEAPPAAEESNSIGAHMRPWGQ